MVSSHPVTEPFGTQNGRSRMVHRCFVAFSWVLICFDDVDHSVQHALSHVEFSRIPRACSLCKARWRANRRLCALVIKYHMTTIWNVQKCNNKFAQFLGMLKHYQVYSIHLSKQFDLSFDGKALLEYKMILVLEKVSLRNTLIVGVKSVSGFWLFGKNHQTIWRGCVKQDSSDGLIHAQPSTKTPPETENTHTHKLITLPEINMYP